MRCPHCTTDFHEEWIEDGFLRANKTISAPFRGTSVWADWMYRTTLCSKCKDVIVEIAPISSKGGRLQDWRMVYPFGASRGPVSSDVPTEIADDYIEACNVLPISPKASAALSRRCLQTILHREGYKVGSGDLAKEIDLLLNEPNPKKAIPQSLHDTVDAIRNFGNFGAHPINDKTALQIIEVDDHEAEWCLQILEECFEHFYTRPAAAKERKAALDAKLAAAGKPPSR